MTEGMKVEGMFSSEGGRQAVLLQIYCLILLPMYNL